jgi:large subunit ribosomal protein L25
MEQMKAVAREKNGSHATQQLRQMGMVPGIMYGHGQANQCFAVAHRDLEFFLKAGEHLVELELTGQRETCLLKAVQRDAFDHRVLHIDLTRVDLNETVQVTVAVVLRGVPKGEAQGGVLTPGALTLNIECVVTSIPEEIRVNVRDLDVGGVLRVRDLPPLEGGRILNNPEVVVASCSVIVEAEVAPAVAVEGEEKVEPELIRREKGEEEEPAAQE